MYDFSLYIHWPFCLSKCPYCDFNSHVSKSVDYDKWAEAYKISLLYHKNHFPLGNIKTIFFGGGTPSLMPASLVKQILNDAEALFGFASDIEISLEANPTSVEAEKFYDYAKAGVNRLSMGVQALNDRDLKILGRTHSVREAKEAFTTAKNIFKNISFDLIYARQGQTPDLWRQELEEGSTWAVGHISLYQLTIEEGTRFADWYKRGKISVPPDTACEEMYFLTDDVLKTQGYNNYEVSNYAKAGKKCQHNLAYWRYQPYIGIGPGAHGRVPLMNGHYMATDTVRLPEEWLNSVLTQNHPAFVTQEKLSRDDMYHEYVMMGLRLSEGINLTRFPDYQMPEKKLYYLLEENFVTLENDILKVTAKGRPLLNGILAEVL